MKTTETNLPDWQKRKKPASKRWRNNAGRMLRKIRIAMGHRDSIYPPDLQDEATKTVLAQAELLSSMWAVA